MLTLIRTGMHTPTRRFTPMPTTLIRTPTGAIHTPTTMAESTEVTGVVGATGVAATTVVVDMWDADTHLDSVGAGMPVAVVESAGVDVGERG